MAELDMFFGAASGAERKALRRLQEPNVMISYATQENTPWDGIDSLFVDSGGYTLMLKEGQHPPVNEYKAYIRKHEPDYWAYQDYPCEPDILETYGRSVEDHIKRTVKRGKVFADADLPGTGVPVVQGWGVSDYLTCIGRMRDVGILPAERVGIGSVCGRDSPAEIAEIIRRVGSELDCDIHGFGVKSTALSYPSVRKVLSSADSLAYDIAARHKHKRQTWREVGLEYLRMKIQIDERTAEDDQQQRLPV